MDCSRVFIRGLPPNISAHDFKNHFSKQFGTTDAKLIPHRRIGYVGYKTPEDAAKAVKYYNKSFIRMSRIGVELARSIEEQSALRPTTESTDRVKRKHEATQGDDPGRLAFGVHGMENDETVPKSKDNKLHDFLEAMQPPSKTRTWEEQAPAATQISAKPSSIALGEQSNNDRTGEGYEPEPKRQKSGHEIIHREEQPDQQSDQSAPSEKDLNKEFNISSNAEDKERGTQIAPDPAPAQSDADWLRSRTSRLLGLVDDNDSQATIALPDSDQAPKASIDEQPKQLGITELSGGDVKTKPNASEEDAIGDVIPSSQLQETAVDNRRLFIRNLTYSTTEDDLRQLFEKGKYGSIEELHLPIESRAGNNKGFAHIQFMEPEAATRARLDLDQKPFQGRLLHVMPANAKKEDGLDEFAISKLPLKKQQQIRKKAEAATSIFNWNSLFMNTDAIMSSISDRLGVSKSDLLDPTSSHAAVKQAHAETHIIQETKSYFTANGVDLDAFKHKARGDTAILIKNFSYGTKSEELRNLFEPYGHISRLLMPPSGTIAIIEFGQPDHACSAFRSLAYRKFKESILFLEKAPKGLFRTSTPDQEIQGSSARSTKLQANELLANDELSESINTSTLFVRNLNFITTTEHLREVFQPLDGFLSARVKTKADPKKPGQLLSMGFGFLEFRTKDNAQAALKAMDGYKLDGHNLLIRASHRAVDAAEERRKEDQAKKEAGRKTKIIIKNLPFQASRKDVRSLFGAYGQLRSVRVPKKFDSSTRGFAFAEFITAREAENAMGALKDTHLLGRRLVLEFAAGDAIDPEQEIEKMQQKVGRQANKVALQRLTGSARKKFNVEGVEELDQD